MLLKDLNNSILTYENKMKIWESLYELSQNNPYPMKKILIGKTNFEYNIWAYKIGKGKKTTVISGNTHGTEMISGSFITELGEDIVFSKRGINYDLKNRSYTFIPSRNPESEKISNAALGRLINNKTCKEEAEIISKEYYLRYTIDDFLAYSNYDLEQYKSLLVQAEKDLNKAIQNNETEIENLQKNVETAKKKNDNIPHKFIQLKELLERCSEKNGITYNRIKNLIDLYENGSFIDTAKKISFHLDMFKEADWNNISDNDYNLKINVRKILHESNYSFPKGCMINWRANGFGIEIMRNNIINHTLQRKKKLLKKPIYGIKRFNKIPNLVFGPLGATSIDDDNYIEEPENKYLKAYLEALYQNDQLCGYFEIHGTGGKFEWEPNFSIKKTDLDKQLLITEINKKVGNIYKKETGYGDLESSMKGTIDIIRATYPGVFLIELATMGGNPIGPYGSIENSYKKTIEMNIRAISMAIQELHKHLNYVI